MAVRSLPRSLVRVAGRGVLATALVLTVCEVLAGPPAHAEEEVILETPPAVTNGEILTVTQDITLSDPITITNPGTTLAVEQQCTNGVSTGSFCLGTTDTLFTPDGTPIDWQPVIVSGVPSSPFRLPGSAMDWIVDEAEAYVAVTKGLDSIDLVRTYARADIRAYIFNRLQDILNKKLYGEPMNEQEIAAYRELQAIRKDRLVQSADWALEEYAAWQRNPCGYVPPAPPPGLPAIPNDAASSSLCSSAGGRFSIWAVTDGTPPADTFDRWASYRHPTHSMKAAATPAYQFALTQTSGAITLGVAYVATAVLGVAFIMATSGMSALAATVVAAALNWGTVALASGIGVTMAFAVAGLLFAVVGALVTLAVAIWQMVEDAKPGVDLRDRAAKAGADNDPLKVEASMADYAGLDYATGEDPAEASKKAYIHGDAFQQELFLLVHDWQMFRHDGTFMPDPTSGYNPTGATTANDVHFDENGTVRDPVTVLAPPDTRNRNGELLSGYRVRISRGFLMVAELVTGEQTFRPYQPRTSVKFVDVQGRPSLMSIVRVGQADGPPVRKFVFTTIDDDEPVHGSGTSWTYFQNPGVLKTVTLLEQLPVTPQVNVIPSVQGDLVADHLVRLKANASDPALSKTGGQYTWVVERLDDQGNVVAIEDIPEGNLTGFDHRFSVPGKYRARVGFAWTGPEAGSAAGRVEFSITRPAAEVSNSFPTAEDREPRIQDDRINSDALSLDLRMMQDTRTDTFQVDVAWANDGLGNEIVEHYTVQCVQAGPDHCDTGPLLPPSPGQPPDNDQWSEPPTFTIPSEQNFLPHVRVTITNGYGETIDRVFAIEGEHRPTYATTTPYVEMPAGTDTEAVDVVQVFPSELFPPPSTPGLDRLQIQPFMPGLIEELPPGVTPQMVQKPNGEWWLQLRGHPTADSIGQWTFYYPFEQVVDEGNYRRPAPALTTLEVVSSTTPGYRGIIRGAPQDLSERVYRTAYPDWMVQAAQRLPGDEGEFTPFAGTVMCKLEASGNVVFDKPCAANGPFPWPDQVVVGQQLATVYLESDTEPISADGPYTVNLIGNFLDPSVTIAPVDIGDTTAAVHLRIDDATFQPAFVVPPPFSESGYTVACSVDGGAYEPCLDGGDDTVPSSPGTHTLDVKVVAPDDATVVRRATWNGGPVLGVDVTRRPVAAKALKAVFDIDLTYGGGVAPPYSGQGFAVKCVADGKVTPCDSGTLRLLRVPGRHELVVTARAPAPDAQSVTDRLVWRVGTPRTRLTVEAPATAARGSKMTVRAKGLLPRERFVVKLAGDKVARGKANARGKVSEDVLVPRSLALGRVKVVVRGATPKRIGKDVVRVVAPRVVAPRVVAARLVTARLVTARLG